MTISGLAPVVPTTPQKLGSRALLVAAACGMGGACWMLGDAATASPLAPLTHPAAPAAAVVPAPWALDPARWAGLAGFTARAAWLAWPLFAAALVLVASAALAVIHPGAFQRRAPYRLSGQRTAIAVASALLVGLALPATLLLPGGMLARPPSIAPAGAMRVALGGVVCCSFLWTLAGPGVRHPRALLRFAHGGIAGFGIVGSVGLALALIAPFAPVVELGAVPAAIRDAGLGRPGATWGTLLGWRLVVHFLGFALAGAVAVTGGPQSVGREPRLAAGAVSFLALAMLLIAGLGAGGAARRLVRDLDPDVVAELELRAGSGPAVLLLSGAGTAVARGASMRPPERAVPMRECAGEGVAFPAADESNAQRLEQALAGLGTAVSVRSSRTLACLVAVRALMFQPDRARAALLDDEAPGRVPPGMLAATARGLLERPGGETARRMLSRLADPARFTLAAQLRDRIVGQLAAPPARGATVWGVIEASRPAAWRVGLVRGAVEEDPGGFAPTETGRVLRYMLAATDPDQGGRFVFTGVPAGTYQLALLAPPRAGGIPLSALSVRGDPGQFHVLAERRYDLGTIRLSR